MNCNHNMYGAEYFMLEQLICQWSLVDKQCNCDTVTINIIVGMSVEY